jgi:hypothetical protein
LATNRWPFKVVFIFLVPGLVFGLVFGWLTRWDAMTDFWFVRGDKLLFPTYKYWAGGTLSFMLGIWTGYLLARLRSWQVGISGIRLVGAFLVMIPVPPALALIREASGIGLSVFWDFLLLPGAAIGVIPIGLKLCTRRWENLLTVMMIVAALFSVLGGYAVGVLLEPLRLPRDFLPVVQMSGEEGLISTLAGLWLFKTHGGHRDHSTDDRDQPS